MTDQKGNGSGTQSPVPMSWSRQNSVLTCGYQYYLERVMKFDGGASWATVGGSAVHNVIEQELHKRYERQGADD